MSNTYTPNTAPPGSSDSSGSSPREQAARVGDEAAQAGHRVADVSKDQASRVASEAKKQASDVLSEARTQLSDQAAHQQARVASGLRSISEELTEMTRSTDNADGGGVANDLVQQAAQRAGSVASWLDARDPGSLLQEVRAFARRKPGTFIAIAATAGVLAGRLTRGVVSAGDGSPSTSAPHRHDASISAESGRPAPRPASTLGTASLGTSGLGADDLTEDPDFQRGDGLSRGTGYRGVDGLGSDR
ncbi:hypothetical protein D6T64_02435 [Cryobacterium melibiosiphilum]|uniref:Uncharacterized protein n=1 Tax=Cryobacterium melibiosiphilum TaxID=995039 RepID=A0A3A5MM70_9MICO|nr:hypothetical protein [Cryobacterium melibiosiphilum]RJT91190.1 hypothetical protein D6T64_02435 [Cryobacterium melibiosiphilum]